MGYEAVLFDLGGVVVGSPLTAIARFEREQGLPRGFINDVVVATAPGGAWARLERGEVTMEEFFPSFEDDCREAGHVISARDLMARVADSTQPRPMMLAAIARIRAQGMKTAAITNNWLVEDGEGTSVLRPHFDVFVESATVGMRKPDPRIYELACRELGIVPPSAIFLDDIGTNLKAARALGMATIKVTEPDAALAELEAMLGFDLRA